MFACQGAPRFFRHGCRNLRTITARPTTVARTRALRLMAVLLGAIAAVPMATMPAAAAQRAPVELSLSRTRVAPGAALALTYGGGGPQKLVPGTQRRGHRPARGRRGEAPHPSAALPNTPP